MGTNITVQAHLKMSLFQNSDADLLIMNMITSTGNDFKIEHTKRDALTPDKQCCSCIKKYHRTNCSMSCC